MKLHTYVEEVLLKLPLLFHRKKHLQLYMHVQKYVRMNKYMYTMHSSPPRTNFRIVTLPNACTFVKSHILKFLCDILIHVYLYITM